MPMPRVRDFHDDDLDQVVRVWEESRTAEQRDVHGLAEVLATIRDEGAAVVSVVGEVVVGAAAARISGDRGWVVLLALANDRRDGDLGSALLTELEKRLMGRGVHRLSGLLAEDEAGVKAFHDCGDEQRDLTYFERVIPLQPQEVGLLGELGGRILPGGLWERWPDGAREGGHRAAGRAAAGRSGAGGRVRRQAAARDRAVRPARDGQDDVRQGGGLPARVAVRRGLPLPPRRCRRRPALALRETFTEIEALEHAVVFIDEVEEIAGQPAASRRRPSRASRTSCSR